MRKKIQMLLLLIGFVLLSLLGKEIISNFGTINIKMVKYGLSIWGVTELIEFLD